MSGYSGPLDVGDHCYVRVVPAANVGAVLVTGLDVATVDNTKTSGKFVILSPYWDTGHLVPLTMYFSALDSLVAPHRPFYNWSDIPNRYTFSGSVQTIYNSDQLYWEILKK